MVGSTRSPMVGEAQTGRCLRHNVQIRITCLAVHLSKLLSSRSVRYPVSNKEERSWRRLLTSASGLHTYLYSYRYAHAHTHTHTNINTLMNMYMYIPKCPSLGNDSVAEVFKGSREASTTFFWWGVRSQNGRRGNTAGETHDKACWMRCS